MNLLPHPVSKHTVDLLVSGHRAQALEGMAHDEGFKMMAIALNGDAFTVQALGQITFNIFRSNHDSYSTVA